MVDELEIHSSVAYSDHNVVMFKIIYETTFQKNNMKVFNYHHGNYLQMCNELQLVNWDNRFYEKNVDFMWVDLLNQLTDLRTKYVPQKVLPKRQLPRWITTNIRLSTKNLANYGKSFL